MDYRHDAATAWGPSVVLACPAFTRKTAGRPSSANFVFQSFEFGAELIAQVFEPGARYSLALFQRQDHGGSLAKAKRKNKAISRHALNFS
jgi:hypothetical protein